MRQLELLACWFGLAELEYGFGTWKVMEFVYFLKSLCPEISSFLPHTHAPTHTHVYDCACAHKNTLLNISNRQIKIPARFTVRFH